MSRKTRRRSSPAPASAVDPLIDGAWSGYAGAAWTRDRGHILWPTLDTRLELDSFSRDELMRRIRALKANLGFIRGIIQNAAVLVGYQTVQADSGDPIWNNLAEDVFYESALVPESFDIAGKWDFEEAQLGLSRLRFSDGDSLVVLGEWPSGAPRFSFYEAHQLRSPDRAARAERWKNGILMGKGGRHLAYGIHDPETGKTTAVPAANVIYNGRFDSPGHPRAIPPLAHAVNHATDITEIWAYLKKAVKISSLLGAVREMEGNSQPRSREGLAGPRRVVEQADGSKTEVTMAWEGGVVPRLDPGEKMKILADDRPHPNIRHLIDDLINDIAMGFGLPSEVIWRMISLTGPGVRFIMDFADRWISDQHRLQQRFARRVWAYSIAKKIKMGKLPMPSDGQWWKCQFTPQRSLTIDRRNESRSRLDELDAGVGTWQDWEKIDGRNWRERMHQRITEIQEAQQACEKAGVPFDRVFPGRPGQAAPAPMEANATPDTEAAAKTEN